MIRLLILLWLVIFTSFAATAQHEVKHDSGFIQLRSFDNKAIEQLKKDPDFQYNKSTEPATGLWQRFWRWIWQRVGGVFKVPGSGRFIQSLLIIAGIALIIFFIIKINGMQQGGLFRRNVKGRLRYTVGENDIYAISFANEIVKAMKDENYRLAVRLEYLQALKHLADRGYIQWRINKTNSDYVAETSGEKFSKIFRQLTLHFDYIWYGERILDKEKFMKIKHEFDQFNTLVNERI